MDYEKKYKEAIERAKTIDKREYRDIISTIFPELKESKESEDERIRKAIGYAIGQSTHSDGTLINEVSSEEALAWLEEQGEQKPTESQKDYYNIDPHFGKPIDFKAKNFYVSKVDGKIHDMTYSSANKVEPKFKIDDWITFYRGNPFKILKVEQEQNGILDYLLLDQNGRDSYYNKKYVDENARLWTIQDAKKGDILEFVDHGRLVVGIVSFVNERIGKVDVSCLLEDNKFKIGNFYALDTINPHPAIKEQRDLLSQKMKEAGFELDDSTKELKKINSYCQENCKGYQETGKCFADGGCDAKRKAEQNSAAWSEEDETGLNDALWAIKQARAIAKDENDMGNLWYAENWLKSIKNRVQPKQEWSKKDEKMRIYTCKFLDDAKQIDYSVPHKEDIDKCISWLKSLKQRVTWKPSVDQLRYLLKYAEQNNYDGTILTSLYKDLKRLCV